MNLVNSFEEVREYINNIRNLRNGFITNFYPEQNKVELWISHNALQVLNGENAVIFLKKDDGFTSVYYCATNIEELSMVLSKLPQEKIFVVDQIIDARTDSAILESFINGGFQIRKSLVRMSKINNTSSALETDNINFTIKEGDIFIINKLLQENFDKYSEQLPTLEELKDFIEANHIIIQRVDNEIAGFIIYDQTPSTLYLRYWLVIKRFRDKGIGSSLFHEYSKRGVKCKRHILWVMEDNENALIKYRHYGYKEENMKNFTLIKYN